MLRPPVQFSFLGDYWVLTAVDLIISVLLWLVGLSKKKKKHTSKEQEGNYAPADSCWDTDNTPLVKSSPNYAATNSKYRSGTQRLFLLVV